MGVPLSRLDGRGARGEGVPQKFTTFTTFTTFAMFAIFAKFAKFANFNPALEHPTRRPRHAPRPGSISEGASRTSPLSCLRRAGYPRSGWRARGVRVQNRQRVAPYGSTVATPKTVWKVKR